MSLETDHSLMTLVVEENLETGTSILEWILK